MNIHANFSLKAHIGRIDQTTVKTWIALLSTVGGCSALAHSRTLNDIAHAATQPTVTTAIATSLPAPAGQIASLLVAAIAGYAIKHFTAKGKRS